MQKENLKKQTTFINIKDMRKDIASIKWEQSDIKRNHLKNQKMFLGIKKKTEF